MSDFRGDVRSLEAFKAQLDKYISEMRAELKAMNSKSSEARQRVHDGAVSGAINHFIGQYEKIEADISELDAASKTLGAMILRFRKAEEKGKQMRNLDNGRHR